MYTKKIHMQDDAYTIVCTGKKTNNIIENTASNNTRKIQNHAVNIK
jgi:hypothetical protein